MPESQSVEPGLCLTGVGEASLYRDPEQSGYFSLLWRENGPEGPAWLLQGTERRPRQRSYPLREMHRIVESLDQHRDTWISQAEFIRPNRRVINLLRLGLCFVDLDTYKTPWQVYPPDRMANILRGFCQDE